MVWLCRNVVSENCIAAMDSSSQLWGCDVSTAFERARRHGIDYQLKHLSRKHGLSLGIGQKKLGGCANEYLRAW